MTTVLKRDQLLTLIAEADDKKLSELYAMCEPFMHTGNAGPFFSQQETGILEERRSSLLNGTENGVDWSTIHENIRIKRNAAR